MKKKLETALAKATATCEVAEPMDQEQMFNLYRDVVAPGANLTKNQFAWYVLYCQQRGYDPLGKDVFLVPRSMKQADGSWKTILTPQSSIDAFRKRATRSNAYEGQDGPYWCGLDGVWKDVWLSKVPPAAAKVSIMRRGFQKPVPGIALYAEYVQTDKQGNVTKFWKNMPANQLAKCAESLALRKAFPDEFGGIYTAEEMAQAEVVDVLPPAYPDKPYTERLAAGETEADPVPVDGEVIDEQPNYDEANPPPLEDEYSQDPVAVAQKVVPGAKVQNVPMPKAMANGPTKKVSPTAGEIAAIKQAWKTLGLSRDDTLKQLDILAGGRRAGEWTADDVKVLKDFLGPRYVAPVEA